MYEKLLTLLSTKFSQARKDGLQQLARSFALQVADENEAQALVEKLTAEKVTDFIKEWRQAVDSEVTKGTKTYEERMKEKYDFVEKKPNDPNPPKPDNKGDVSALIQEAVKTAVAGLQTEIQSLKQVKVAETRKQAFEEALKNAPNSFKNSMLKSFEKMSFENEEAFQSFLSETQTDLKEVLQDFNNGNMNQFPRPEGSSGTTNKQVADDFKQWAEKK